MSIRFPRGSVVGYITIGGTVFCNITLKGGVSPIASGSGSNKKLARLAAWHACEEFGLVTDGIDS